MFALGIIPGPGTTVTSGPGMTVTPDRSFPIIPRRKRVTPKDTLQWGWTPRQVQKTGVGWWESTPPWDGFLGVEENSHPSKLPSTRLGTFVYISNSKLLYLVSSKGGALCVAFKPTWLGYVSIFYFLVLDCLSSPIHSSTSAINC